MNCVVIEMSYRRTILKRLKHFYDDVGAHENAYILLDPIDIIGKPGGVKYAAAINQLLREHLIVAAQVVNSNSPVFTLNTAKLDEIERELRWWRNPAVLFAVPTAIAFVGLVWGIVKFFLEH